MTPHLCNQRMNSLAKLNLFCLTDVEWKLNIAGSICSGKNKLSKQFNVCL